MKLRRLTPVVGLLTVIVGVAGSFFAAQGNSPDPSAKGAQVLAFYVANATSQRLASVLLVLAFGFFVIFAAFLRAYMRTTSVSEALGTLALAGAAVLLVGQASGASVGFALSGSPSSVSPDAAQALNVLQSGLVLIPGSGLFLFGLAAGAAILATRAFPKWLGWFSIVIGLVVTTPAEGFAFLALVLWVLAISFLAWRRPEPA
jgi:hypothetical protein